MASVLTDGILDHNHIIPSSNGIVYFGGFFPIFCEKRILSVQDRLSLLLNRKDAPSGSLHRTLPRTPPKKKNKRNTKSEEKSAIELT